MPSIELQDTGLPVCGKYYLTHRDSRLELRSKMAMKTEWAAAFAMHNIDLGSTNLEVFIKISSDLIQNLLKLMGRTVSHFSSPPSSFRRADTNWGRVKGRKRVWLP